MRKSIKNFFKDSTKYSIIETSLINEIIGQLATDENAQCVTLVWDKHAEDKAITSLQNYHAAVPLTLFEADIASEVSLYHSVKYCPFIIMSWGNVGSATTFIETHMDNLRLY